MGLRDTALNAWKERQEVEALARKVEIEKFNRDQQRRAVAALRAVLGYTDEGAKKLSVTPLYRSNNSDEEIETLAFQIDGLDIQTSISAGTISEKVLEVKVFALEGEPEEMGLAWKPFADRAELGRLLEDDREYRAHLSGGGEAA